MDHIKDKLAEIEHRHEDEIVAKLEEAKSVESDGILLILNKLWTKEQLVHLVREIHADECANCPRFTATATKNMTPFQQKVALWVMGVISFVLVVSLLAIVFGAVGEKGLHAVRETMPHVTGAQLQ